MFKKLYKNILTLLCIFALVASAGCGTTAASESTAPASVESSVIVEAPVKELEPVNTKDDLKSALKDAEHLVWFGNVRNDNTGNWRLAEYSAPDSLETFAAAYYGAFFEDDKEIHAVINMNAMVTGKISKIGDILDVTLYDYIDGEEHDANILFGGPLLAEYWINISTGEIEAIQ